MLTSEQARKNQERCGYNELAEGKQKGVLQIFLEQFKDFLVMILIVAAVVSGFLGDGESAVVIFVVITMNAILGTVQTVKAEQSLNGLKQLSAPAAKVVRDGSLVQIPSREVTVGDEVVVEAGDCIPADGRLLSCASLKTDESALTGESLPVEKSLKMAPKDAALGDQTNRVFSGSFVTYGRGTYEVTAIGMETEVGKIARLLKTASEKRTPLQVNLDEFGKKLSVIILVFCGILFGMNILRGGSAVEAFLFAVALAVAAIPEALSSIVTIVLSFGTQKMAKEHAIVRKLQAVEGLGSVSVICSDKTGTLTQNKMTVEDYYVDGRRIQAEKISLGSRNQELLLRFSILCNDSTNEEGTEIGDPTETALINLGHQLGVNVAEVRRRYPRLSELPFDSDRKRMSTEHRMRLPEDRPEYDGNDSRASDADGVSDGGKGQSDAGSKRIIVVVKGAVDMLLDRIVYIRCGGSGNDTQEGSMPGRETESPEVRKITQEDKTEIERQNLEFSREGLRVLAFAYKELDNERELTLEDEKDLTFLGLIAMMDPPREESKEAVGRCIQAGIKPVMITGDHKITAAAIAKRIGILKDESEACEGAVIENMSDEELKEFVEGISVYARVSPEHKIRIVRAWQDKGNIVAMTGDGVNDAPALKQADIGVAMGITGSEVSKDAAAMVLTDDNFATIVKAVENGRNIYQNIKNAIQFLLSGNFAAILVVLFASAAGLPVPFEPVHLLFINLLTDSLPAIALGLEPHRTEVMAQKPRAGKESILTKDYLLSIGTEGLCIGVFTAAAFVIGYRSGDAGLASTMAFGTLCMSRLVHGFNCKSSRPVVFSPAICNNVYLTGAFLVGTVLITGVLLIPGLHRIFKVAGLGAEQLTAVYVLAFLNLPVVQLLKWIKRRRNSYGGF